MLKPSVLVKYLVSYEGGLKLFLFKYGEGENPRWTCWYSGWGIVGPIGYNGDRTPNPVLDAPRTLLWLANENELAVL